MKNGNFYSLSLLIVLRPACFIHLTVTDNHWKYLSLSFPYGLLSYQNGIFQGANIMSVLLTNIFLAQSIHLTHNPKHKEIMKEKIQGRGIEEGRRVVE